MSADTDPWAAVHRAIEDGHTNGRIMADYSLDYDYVHRARQLHLTISQDHDGRLLIDGRRLSSYFGPASPAVLRELVDAICPPQQGPA